jgi:hypothetical protein
MMKVTTDFSEFFDTVGLIIDQRRLRALGLQIENVTGTISPHEIEDVLDFCAQNPQYHVVSMIGEGIFLNRYDPRGDRFQLCDGDNDPNYMADRRHIFKWMFGK